MATGYVSAHGTLDRAIPAAVDGRPATDWNTDGLRLVLTNVGESYRRPRPSRIDWLVHTNE